VSDDLDLAVDFNADVAIKVGGAHTTAHVASGHGVDDAEHADTRTAPNEKGRTHDE
jgi:hypothetical protein